MRWLGFLVLGAGDVGRVFNYPLYQPVNEVAPPWAEPANSPRWWWVRVGWSGAWVLGWAVAVWAAEGRRKGAS